MPSRTPRRGSSGLGFLRNQPGVKPEEVEALGLGKLFEQPGAVPKEAVLGEIAANRVNVGEVYKGGERPKTFSVSECRKLIWRTGITDGSCNA